MLRKHDTIHKEFRFTCDLCSNENKFRSKQSLKFHIKRYHTFEKDKKCHLCSAAFFGKRDLDCHITAKHLNIRFQCGVAGCKSSLSRKDAYLSHIQKAHKDLTAEERKSLRAEIDKIYFHNNLIKKL